MKKVTKEDVNFFLDYEGVYFDWEEYETKVKEDIINKLIDAIDKDDIKADYEDFDWHCGMQNAIDILEEYINK